MQHKRNIVSEPLAGLILVGLCACTPAQTPEAVGFSVLLKPDVPLLAPVAFYQILPDGDTYPAASTEESLSELVVSAPCEAIDAESWQCQFSYAPRASVGRLLLLLGDTSERCSLEQGLDNCVWPVAFENPEALTGTETHTVLVGIPEEERLLPSQLGLQWLQDGSPARGLEVELSEPKSGMRFGGKSNGTGALEPLQECALWDSYGCFMPPAPTWWVRTQLDSTHPLSPDTHWDPLSGQSVAVSCPDDDDDGFTLAACGLESSDCDDTNATVHPGADEDPGHTGLGDGLDNDCDGAVDDNTRRFDDDGDGYSEEEGDCNDADAVIHPTADEVIGDQVDQDCDGIDPLDADGDGYIASTTLGDDCNDQDPNVHPEAADLVGDEFNQDCSEQDDYLTQFAGTGLFNGEGRQAEESSFSRMRGMAVDTSNRVWVSDTNNQRVRMVQSDGVVVTRVGDGFGRFTSDDRPSEQTSVNWPAAMASGPDGSIYFVDSDNRRIRRVMPDGLIHTVVGDGVSGQPTEGMLATQAEIYLVGGLAVSSGGLLYFSDPNYHRVLMVTADGKLLRVAGVTGVPGSAGDGGPGTSALLSNPQGLDFDREGNLLIADTNNNKIRKLLKTGTLVRAAGTGSDFFSGDGGSALDAGLKAPAAVAARADFSYLIADTLHARIRIVDADGIIQTFAGTGSLDHNGNEGPATDAAISQPLALDVDSDGNVYFVSTDDFRVRQVDTAGIIHNYAGDGTLGYTGDGGQALDAMFFSTQDVKVDSLERVFVLDRSYGSIRRVDVDGTIDTYAGGTFWGYAGDGGPAQDAAINDANALAIDDEDNLYIADSSNHRVRMVTPDGIISTVAGNGVDGYQGDGGPATSASMRYPLGIAVADHKLYIPDKYDHRVRMVDLATGIMTTFAGTGVPGMNGEGGLASEAQVSYPRSVAADSKGNVYISEYGNNRIRKVDSNGIIQTAVGSGAYGVCEDGGNPLLACLVYPGYLTVDDGDNLFFGDGNRVRRLSTAGTVSTVIGLTTEGNGGTPGPASKAAVSAPLGLGFGPTGNLYIADTSNYRVVTIDP